MSARPETKDLLKIIRNLHHIHDYTVLLERILHEARLFVRADAGTLYLRDNDKLYFNYIENDTLFPEGKSEDKFTYTDRSIPLNKSSLAGFVAVTAQPLLIDDVYALPDSLDFTFNPEFDKKSNYHTQSQLVIPLVGDNQKTLGVIQLINAQYGGKTVPFSAMDKVHISFLADHAVLALEKASMAREMVMRMVAIAELRDPYETGSHAKRVGEYALVLYDHFAESRGVSLAERNQKKEAFRAAAILHDVGKALDHEAEGTHIDLSRDIAIKYGMPKEVVHALEVSHEGAGGPETAIDFITMAADAISASRPGARRESVEQYIKRLGDLENIANNFPGVSQAYAIHAGREVRIMVIPEEVDDLGIKKLAKEVAQKIEKDMTYPGTVRVNVIRETRAEETAQ